MPVRWHPPEPLLIVVDSAGFGGAEVYVDLLLRHLPADIPRALAVREPGPRPLLATAAALGIDVVRWTRRPAAMMRLRSAVRSAGLVHLNMPWPGANPDAAALAALHRSPAVATVHLFLPPRNALRGHVLRLVYGRMASVIAVSGDIRRAVASDLGVARGHVHLVPNGIERRDGDDASPPGPGGVVRVGGVGRLTKQKGFDLLIAAAGSLQAEGHRVEVSIAGEGPEGASLEARARGLPVRLVGPVADVHGFLSGLDVFCLPSRWEGLPFALLDAMMAGTACVATAVGDVPEALGPAGVIVPPEDPQALAAAIAALAASPEQRRSLATAAHRRAQERYSVERMIESTVAVYEESRAAHRRA